MPRLPIVGGDYDTWGEILNDYLSVSIDGDGTLNPGAVQEAIGPSGVTPGTYGDGEHVAQFTVGEEGQIVSAVDVPIPGVTPGAYVQLGVLNQENQTTVGSGGDTTVGGDYAFQVSYTSNNPDANIQQAFVSFALFTGQPGAGSGSLEGGSCQVDVLMTNATGNIGPAAVGFEGIGQVDGATTHSIGEVIGLQGSAFAGGTTTVSGRLVSVFASGPFANSGTPTVAEADSFYAAEPTIGTVRRAGYTIGAFRHKKGSATNALELSNASDVLTWAFDGGHFTGYASDGASTRIVLDPGDAATNRILINGQASNTNPLMTLNTTSGAAIIMQNNNGTTLFALTTLGGIRPGNSSSVGGNTIWAGSGAPSIASSVAGDIYFRSDTPSTTNQRIYIATGANTWTGIL